MSARQKRRVKMNKQKLTNDNNKALRETLHNYINRNSNISNVYSNDYGFNFDHKD